MRRARPVRLILALAGVALATTTMAVARSAPVSPRAYAPAIEDYSPYQGQTQCSPTVKPGTAALRALVLRTYAGTGDLGITRSCGSGGRSEHKEGRAWDWRVSATRTADVGRVRDLLAWLLASDRHGNAHAVFRRLGLMYVIWDRRIWTSEARRWEPYYGRDPHTSHVHFSLNRAGGAKQTSFWDGTVNEVARPAGIAQERLVVDVTDPRGRTTRGEVKAGRRYRITVAGTYSPRPGVLADAQCRRGATWARGTATGDARLNFGAPAMVPANPTGGGCDAARHSYSYDYVSGSDRRLNVTLVSDGRFSDNRGALSVLVSALPVGGQPPSPCPSAVLSAGPVVVATGPVPVIDGAALRATPWGCTATVTGSALAVSPVTLLVTGSSPTWTAGPATLPDLTGRWGVGYVATRDLTYRAGSLAGVSGEVTRIVLPVVNRPYDRYPLRNAPVRLSGRAAAGSPVVVRYRVTADRPGALPRVARLQGNAAGAWSFSLPANQLYAFRVGRAVDAMVGPTYVKQPL